MLQIKRFKKSIKIPDIMKTPGTFDGAQFNFRNILEIMAKKEVQYTHTNHHSELIQNFHA